MTPAAAMPDFRYRAFISYSHRDQSWADWLHKALETYAIPKRLVGQATAAGVIPRRLAPVFRDREELASATDLGRKVNEALAQSGNLVVICSPHAASSRWVNEEVLAFKRLGRGERIFCLIVDGEPNAGDTPGQAARECFAPALRHALDADGQPGAQRCEPIAADARAGRDGKANAKLKLIAGLLDLDYDRLKQRELKRRHRRMAALTTLALVVTAITTTLAIAALFARHAAVVARNDAERRQKQAEDLVDFMLGDLNDKLRQVSRLDILAAVDDRAMIYFHSLPTADVTDEALAQRAKALEKIGSVRLDQGQLAAALASFEAAAEISAALAAKAPANTARQLAYAQILSFVGMTHWNQGRLDAAQQGFESARTVLQRARPQAADLLPWQYQQEMIENDIGHVLEARGRLDEATGHYRNALALSEKLVAARPDKTEWALELGGAHNNLGKLALMRGDLATAIAEYAADDAIETTLAARAPGDNEQRDNMLVVRAILGRTLALAGDLETGTRDLQQAVDIAAQLAKVDPANASFQERLAQYSSQLARLRRLGGDLPAARALTAQSLPILLALTRQDPADIGKQREFAEAQLEQAAQSLAGGQAEAARQQAQSALGILAPLSARQPDDRATLLATAQAKLVLAAASGNAQTALPLRSDALDAIHAVKDGADDPRLRALQVEALLALGRKAEARAALQPLWGSGYRDAALLNLLQRERIDYPVNAAFRQKLLAATATNTRP